MHLTAVKCISRQISTNIFLKVIYSLHQRAKEADIYGKIITFCFSDHRDRICNT